MKITDPAGGRWTVVRQVGAWQRQSRLSWAGEVIPIGPADELVMALLALPFLVVMLAVLVFALFELFLLLITLPVVLFLRAIRVLSWRVIVTNTAQLGGIDEMTGELELREERFATTVLGAETLAGSRRLRDAVADHLRRGGDLSDTVVGAWLTAERGKIVWRETKADQEPSPKSDPA